MEKEARNQMVISNLKLVHSRIHKLYPDLIKDKVGYEDYFQSGVIGLIEAIDRLDENTETSASTYMTIWIDCRIKEFKRKDRMIQIPQDAYNKTIKYRYYHEKLNLPKAKVMDIMGISEQQIERLEIASKLMFTGSESGQNAKFWIDPEKVLLKKEKTNALNLAINKLKDTDQELIKDLFGYDDHDEVSMAELGRKYDYTRQGIRAKKEKILCTLKAEILERGI